jgi:serine/threonine protein kinase
MLTPDQARRLLEADLLAGDEEAESLPERIGPYRILQRIASGGMGIVFEAEQERPRRAVAVKVLRPGLLSAAARQRFMLEIEVLGRLRHPCIASIFDAGLFDTGLEQTPYFAMELVPGAVPITTWARQPGVSLAAKLAAFALACDAIQHGHRRGVVHRDVKPANVLVASEPDDKGAPVVKVIDFGIARATDDALAVTAVHTAEGALLGTVPYMSPEQVREGAAAVDVRSDVYALGVLLYELICSRLPHDLSGMSPTQACRIVESEPPVPPRRIDGEVHRDLEAIVLKALQKSPDRRYQSAGALAEDVRRRLRREPVTARAPSPWLKAASWIGRHPIATTAAACVVLLATSLMSAQLAVWALHRRPSRLVLSDDKSRATLLSYAGTELESWDSVERGFAGALLVPRADEWGGGRIALLAYTHDSGRPESRLLAAFDEAGGWRTPAWVAGPARDADLSERLGLEASPTTFSANWATFNVKDPALSSGLLRADVFDDADCPGEEVIVVFTHAWRSPRAIAIFDVRGRLLYQVWHDGSIGSAHWMPDSGLLVAAGCYSRYWNELGVHDVEYEYPQVVFALRPQRGHMGERFIEADDGPETTLAWYRFVLPPAVNSELSVVVHAATGEADAGRRVHLSFRDRQPEPSGWFGLVLDERGEIVPGGRRLADRYRKLKADVEAGRADPSELPDVEAIQLGPVPTAVP